MSKLGAFYGSKLGLFRESKLHARGLAIDCGAYYSASGINVTLSGVTVCTDCRPQGYRIITTGIDGTYYIPINTSAADYNRFLANFTIGTQLASPGCSLPTSGDFTITIFAWIGKPGAGANACWWSLGIVCNAALTGSASVFFPGTSGTHDTISSINRKFLPIGTDHTNDPLATDCATEGEFGPVASFGGQATISL